MSEAERPKAAVLGEPSYVWRAGQDRRWQMIQTAAGERLAGRVLDNGCGVGLYLRPLAEHARQAVGVEYDFERAAQAKAAAPVVNAAGEALPLPSATFDLILSHEVLEHVADDRAALAEMARLLRPGGRLVLFVPNRGYPFETHGVVLARPLPLRQCPPGQLPAAALAQPPGAARAGLLVGRSAAAGGRSAAPPGHHNDHLRRLRQHHRSLASPGKGPARGTARPGAHSAPSAWAVPRLGVGASLKCAGRRIRPAGTRRWRDLDQSRCCSTAAPSCVPPAHSLPAECWRPAGDSPLGSAPLHLALISDVHLLPSEVALGGLQRALDHMHQQRPAVQAILNAGNSIMDALQTPKSEVVAEWEAFNQTMQAGTDLPIYSVIGNHDVWGWGLAEPTLEEILATARHGRSRRSGCPARITPSRWESGSSTPSTAHIAPRWRPVIPTAICPTPDASTTPSSSG